MSSQQADAEELQKVDTPYALDRAGYTASGRLIFQHHLWKDVTGYLIHPRILDDLKRTRSRSENGEVELNVADVGTGTAAWAIDVARMSDSGDVRYKVHGFDISDSQFPPPFVLPPNCQLSTADALAAAPAALHGTFDIVHIAHFACVRALGDDPSPAIKHALELLKPGGWIHWDEWARQAHGEAPIVSKAPAPHCEYALGVGNAIFPKWLLDIAGHLSAHGMVEAAQDVAKLRNDQLLGLTNMWFLTSDEIVRFGFEEPTKSALMKTVLAAYAETKDPKIEALLQQWPSSVIAKKPSKAD